MGTMTIFFGIISIHINSTHMLEGGRGLVDCGQIPHFYIFYLFGPFPKGCFQAKQERIHSAGPTVYSTVTPPPTTVHMNRLSLHPKDGGMKEKDFFFLIFTPIFL